MFTESLWSENEYKQKTRHTKPPRRSFQEQSDSAQREQERADQQDGVPRVTERCTWTPQTYEPTPLGNGIRCHGTIVAPVPSLVQSRGSR